MSDNPPFKPGDKVRHKLIRSWTGTVVRYHKASHWRNGKVFWKGWDMYDPERIDWTWDFAMEKIDCNNS